MLTKRKCRPSLALGAALNADSPILDPQIKFYIAIKPPE
jgi:hypothetical protein